MAAVVKKTEGPFGKRGGEEKFSSVGTAPGNSAEGEAIVDYDDDWVGLTKRGRGQAAKVTQLCFAECEIVRWASPRRLTHLPRHCQNLGILRPCHSY